MDRALVVALRARGIDVLTALDADMFERDDTAHLSFSTLNDRVLLTCNTGDFCRIHKELLTDGRQHGGIVCICQQTLFDRRSSENAFTAIRDSQHQCDEKSTGIPRQLVRVTACSRG
jgi:hypothetical protein